MSTQRSLSSPGSSSHHAWRHHVVKTEIVVETAQDQEINDSVFCKQLSSPFPAPPWLIGVRHSIGKHRPGMRLGSDRPPLCVGEEAVSRLHDMLAALPRLTHSFLGAFAPVQQTLPPPIPMICVQSWPIGWFVLTCLDPQTRPSVFDHMVIPTLWTEALERLPTSPPALASFISGLLV